MAGSIVVAHSPIGNIRRIVCTCVGDPVDGSFPPTKLPTFEGCLHDLSVQPGPTNPSSGYSIAIADESGHDLLENTGVGLSESAYSKKQIVYSGTSLCPPVDESNTLMLVVRDNAAPNANLEIALMYALGSR